MTEPVADHLWSGREYADERPRARPPLAVVPAPSPSVAIVQDFLVQRGGAERVALALSDAFPRAEITTGCYAPDQTYPEFADRDVRALWPNRIPQVRRDPRRAMPVLADVFGRHRVRNADVVICSSSGYAHGVRTEAPKLVYCHNPARWLYQSKDFFGSFPPAFERLTRPLLARERRRDRGRAQEAAVYLANSRTVRDRIWRHYGIDALVVPPPAGLSPIGEVQPVPGLTPGFHLTVGRNRGYKNTASVVAAFAELPGERLVVVGTHAGATPNVSVLSGIPDPQLRWLYANAAALIAVSFEDFGLTPVEAFGFGTPVLALHGGGYLDTCVEGLTGLWLERPDPVDIRRAVRSLPGLRPDPQAIITHGRRWSPEIFRDSIGEQVAALA